MDQSQSRCKGLSVQSLPVEDVQPPRESITEDVEPPSERDRILIRPAMHTRIIQFHQCHVSVISVIPFCRVDRSLSGCTYLHSMKSSGFLVSFLGKPVFSMTFREEGVSHHRVVEMKDWGTLSSINQATFITNAADLKL